MTRESLIENELIEQLIEQLIDLKYIFLKEIRDTNSIKLNF